MKADCPDFVIPPQNLIESMFIDGEPQLLVEASMHKILLPRAVMVAAMNRASLMQSDE